MKTVIYHSADYDGIFCREIAKRFLGTEGVNYIGWNFGDPPIKIPEEGDLYVMDLPTDKPFGWPMPLIFLPGHRNLIWIDHHKSSIETHPKDIPGYRIDGVAACRLAWHWFSAADHLDTDPKARLIQMGHYDLPKKQDFIDRKVTEPLAVRLCGEYDIWDHRGDGDLEFQFGLDAQQELNWSALLNPYATGPIDQIVQQGKAAMACYRKRDSDIMRERSFSVLWEGLHFLCLNTARCNSNTFAALDVPATGHDGLLAFYWNGKVWSVSLYHAAHRKDIDLSLIAVKHGGGGHRGACGFTCSKLPFLP